MNDVFRTNWAESMSSYINGETISIIINNLMVMLVMCLFTIIPFFVFNMKERKYKDLRQMITLIFIAYMLYFLKEGFRAGIGLLSFPHKSYLFGVFILTLPHGIIEITGFAIAASAIFNYFMKNIGRDTVYRYLMLAVSLILVAGVLETTLTPFLFRFFV